MSALPPFDPLHFPRHLTVRDFPMTPVPVHTLTDEQARTYWRSQEDLFIAHVRKLRAIAAGATR